MTPPPHIFAYPPPDQHLTLEETKLLANLDEHGPNADPIYEPREPLHWLLENIIDNVIKWDPVRLLLERQVNVNRLRHTGCTPLLGAYFMRRLDVPEVLLQTGANMYAKCCRNASLDVMTITLANDEDHAFTLSAVTQLIKHGYDVRRSQYKTHILCALNWPIDQFKELFEKLHMEHMLWHKLDGVRMSASTQEDWSDKAEHRRFLQQHEFMTQLVVLCVPRTCHKSPVRKLPRDMWRLVGEMSFGQPGGMRA